MKYLDLPNDVDQEQLAIVKQILVAEAEMKAFFNGVKMELCGEETTWDNCFSGFFDEDTRILYLMFNYNIGSSTLATSASIKI